MQLDILKGKPIQDPTEKQIIDALDKVYRNKLDAVVLSGDKEGNRFIQVIRGGFYLEYKEGPRSDIYSVDEVSLEDCQDTFLDYARGGDAWRTALPWTPTLDFRGRPL